MPNHLIKAMISSTFRDLVEHRLEAILACLQQKVLPLAMETIPASNRTPLEVSLDMVEEADIYIGIFGYRYGTTIPRSDDISITHREYLYACKRDIPRLIFIMDETHLVTVRMVEVGSGSNQLRELIELIESDEREGRVTNRFTSSEDLRGKISVSLAEHIRSTYNNRKEKFSPHSKVTERYENDDLVGRREAFGSLTNWVAHTTSSLPECRNSIYVIVASSGMGKSLLSWKWFASITPKLWNRAMWWSFYQDSDFEAFQNAALVDFLGKGKQEVEELNTDDRRMLLLKVLQQNSFLIVLDGLEHALVGRNTRYRALDRHIVSTPVENFLNEFRKLENLTSKILITTTIYPSVLARANGEPLNRVFRRELQGLSDDEALELWEELGLSNSDKIGEELCDLMNRFNNHPLFIRALAGAVKNDLDINRNFDQWWNLNRDNFLESSEEISKWMSRLLRKTLSKSSKQVLLRISAFYCPCRQDMLSTLMSEVGMSREILSEALADLQLRNLIKRVQDRETVFYNIHQLIIDAAWGRLKIRNQVELATSLFKILVNHHLYNDAYTIFIGRLNQITFALKYNSLRAELLEKFFPNGIQTLPNIAEDSSILHEQKSVLHDKRAIIIASLVRAYLIFGKLKQAVVLSRNHVTVREEVNQLIHAAKGQYYLAYELYQLGELYEAELQVRDALVIFDDRNKEFWKVLCLKLLEHLLVVRGKHEEAQRMGQEARSIQLTFGHRRDDEIDEIAHIENQKELLNSIAAEVNQVERKLSDYIKQAKHELSGGNYNEVRQFLDKVFEYEDYRLFHADAFIILSNLERVQNNREAAILAANNAFQKAWCDGRREDSLYVYYEALEEAKRILDSYACPYPEFE
jgi:hypothetical protein